MQEVLLFLLYVKAIKVCKKLSRKLCSTFQQAGKPAGDHGSKVPQFVILQGTLGLSLSVGTASSLWRTSVPSISCLQEGESALMICLHPEPDLQLLACAGL